MADTCAHVDQVRRVEPRTPNGCEECLQAGTTWVKLRECLTCGHVGCCDSSPGTHATAHYNSSHHPIMKSFEPGEQWGWCYPDKLTFERAPAASA